MGRGKTTLVRCNGCGRSVSRGKAVVDFRPIVYSTDLRTADDLRYMEKRKVYYCVSCGKSLGVYEKKKRQNEIYRERNARSSDTLPMNLHTGKATASSEI